MAVLSFDLAINSYPVQFDATLILYSPTKTFEIHLNTEFSLDSHQQYGAILIRQLIGFLII